MIHNAAVEVEESDADKMPKGPFLEDDANSGISRLLASLYSLEATGRRGPCTLSVGCSALSYRPSCLQAWTPTRSSKSAIGLLRHGSASASASSRLCYALWMMVASTALWMILHQNAKIRIILYLSVTPNTGHGKPCTDRVEIPQGG
jgi:hypothetical protein